MKYFVVFAGIVAIGAGIFFITTRGHAAPPPISGPIQNQSTSTASVEQKEIKIPRIPPAGQKEYQSDTYHVSLFVPENIAVKEYDEGGGATTVTFQDVKDAQGFQIFIVPYTQDQISDVQFKKDEPSGVRLDSQDITIDGSTAVSFFSKSLLLGDTAEIWFIHDGYLYEVTAPKSLASWLSDIMLTWKFI